MRQKKLTMWKEVVESANVDFEGSKKDVGRENKG